MTPATNIGTSLVHSSECFCFLGRKITSPVRTAVRRVSVHIVPSPATTISDSSYRCRCGHALLRGISPMNCVSIVEPCAFDTITWKNRSAIACRCAGSTGARRAGCASSKRPVIAAGKSGASTVGATDANTRIGAFPSLRRRNASPGFTYAPTSARRDGSPGTRVSSAKRRPEISSSPCESSTSSATCRSPNATTGPVPGSTSRQNCACQRAPSDAAIRSVQRAPLARRHGRASTLQT
jgi:hypothetical protein